MPDVKEIRDLLFRIVRKSDRHEFTIYTNGEIEGFGDDDCIVFNMLPRAIMKQQFALALREPYRCPDCGGYAVGGGCTCSLEMKHKRWDEATKDDPERGTGNRIL
jgi:hypothetical protein